MRDVTRRLFAPNGFDNDVGIGSQEFVDVVREEIRIDGQASLTCYVSNENADELDFDSVTRAQRLRRRAEQSHETAADNAASRYRHSDGQS